MEDIHNYVLMWCTYRGIQKCVHALIEFIYGHNNKVEPKCNVLCVV
jgi:hypothetical protein